MNLKHVFQANELFKDMCPFFLLAKWIFFFIYFFLIYTSGKF